MKEVSFKVSARWSESQRKWRKKGKGERKGKKGNSDPFF